MLLICFKMNEIGILTFCKRLYRFFFFFFFAAKKKDSGQPAS